ncbi:hypothetical protein D8674_040709 [Pyrus ussuriensis x Pyrus communis]|uniref:Uncharacterized protein n=1 Tax=Pyrus ussuriensis x Pyrus communis TaxID=2448454 RepID=A0A5N5FM15_9ROSA|nr:hypothetical protein D8674_040709 [Pyrus ussuriensis x Pyrus communis]
MSLETSGDCRIDDHVLPLEFWDLVLEEDPFNLSHLIRQILSSGIDVSASRSLLFGRNSHGKHRSSNSRWLAVSHYQYGDKRSTGPYVADGLVRSKRPHILSSVSLAPTSSAAAVPGQPRRSP